MISITVTGKINSDVSLPVKQGSSIMKIQLCSPLNPTLQRNQKQLNCKKKITWVSKVTFNLTEESKHRVYSDEWPLVNERMKRNKTERKAETDREDREMGFWSCITYQVLPTIPSRLEDCILMNRLHTSQRLNPHFLISMTKIVINLPRSPGMQYQCGHT